MAVAERKAHVAAYEGVDFGRLDRLERGEGCNEPRLERRETLRGRRRVGREYPPAYALDGAERVHRRRFHLISEGLHVGGEARLNNILRGHPFLRTEGLRLAE